MKDEKTCALSSHGTAIACLIAGMEGTEELQNREAWGNWGECDLHEGYNVLFNSIFKPVESLDSFLENRFAWVGLSVVLPSTKVEELLFLRS